MKMVSCLRLFFSIPRTSFFIAFFIFFIFFLPFFDFFPTSLSEEEEEEEDDEVSIHWAAVSLEGKLDILLGMVLSLFLMSPSSS